MRLFFHDWNFFFLHDHPPQLSLSPCHNAIPLLDRHLQPNYLSLGSWHPQHPILGLILLQPSCLHSKSTPSSRARAIRSRRARYGSSASQPEKLAVILDILQEKVKHEEAKYTLPDKFHTANQPLFSRLLLAIASVNVSLGQIDKAEDAYRTLVAKRNDESDLVPVYNLSGFLIHDGTASKVEEGLELAGPCMEWLDKKLGRASPQAIGVRRNIAEAEWKLGRRERAGEMIKEVYECIDELKGTKFAVYEDDEREFAREWEKGLRE
ncbi:hypothetical protein AbraIFM66951_002495 [Aspergillus brasiliensis]|uniref:Uncharacterized protein n=1 Tax=Aspergillus brasiliensis TaxID=319629 RepID=A0A9W6DSZ8_9EURO|nr:hypothetical protein AbraCBS73388_002894 [Aspergillus brasiliensis]GKZ49789.1 hypothetical protein AbraIFM66951_002495 [Aspergillus brasiliensis]